MTRRQQIKDEARGARRVGAALVLCVCVVGAGSMWGGTVSGYLTGSDGQPLTNSIISFVPKQTPIIRGLSLQTTREAFRRVTNGFFTVPVLGGAYRVTIDQRDPFFITVPDSTNGWALDSLTTTGLSAIATAPPTVNPWTSTIAKTNVWGGPVVVLPGENRRGTLHNAGNGMMEWEAGSVNVSSYGAMGDGFTDDTISISNAVANLQLNSFGRRSGKIVFPPGYYVVSAPIRIPTGTIVEGEGEDATVLLNESATNTTLWLAPTLPKDSTITTTVIRDLMIWHTGSPTAGYGIDLDTSPTNYSCYVEIENVHVLGPWIGVHTKGIVFGRFSKVTTTGCGWDGWWVENPANGCTWTQCSSHHNGRYGMMVDEANYCGFVNNAWENNVSHGFMGGTAEHRINCGMFLSNGTEYNGGSGIVLEDAQHTTVANHYNEGGVNGVEQRGGLGNKIENCDSLFQSGVGVLVTTNLAGYPASGWQEVNNHSGGGGGYRSGPKPFFHLYETNRMELSGTAAMVGTPYEALALDRQVDSADTRLRLSYYDAGQHAVAIDSVREGGATEWGLSFLTGSGTSSGGPSERMRLTSSGYLGIGKLPEVALDVAGALRLSGAASVDSLYSTGVIANPSMTTFGNGLRVYGPMVANTLGATNGIVGVSTGDGYSQAGLSALSTGTDDSTILIGNALQNWRLANRGASGRLDIAAGVTGTEVLTMMPSRNVGVGTTNPVARLQVVGDGLISGNLGIGTTNPAAPLAIEASSFAGTVFTPIELRRLDNNLGTQTRIAFYDGPGQYASAIESQRATNGATDWELSFWTGSGTSSGGPSKRVTISPTGTLGVLGGVTDLGGVTYTWPTNQGSAATYLRNDGSGLLSWSAVSGGTGTGAVSSVFGRSGDVVAAGGDYAASQVSNDSGVTGFSVASALNTLSAGKADASHTHAGSAITSAVDQATHAVSADISVLATNAYGLLMPAKVTTTNYSMSTATPVVFADCSTGAVVLTLPLATGITGAAVWVKKVDTTTNTLTVVANTGAPGDRVEGALALTNGMPTRPAWQLISGGGTNWYLF